MPVRAHRRVKDGPKLSICQITTKYLSVEDDLRPLVEDGIDGISLRLSEIEACGICHSFGAPAVSCVPDKPGNQLPEQMGRQNLTKIRSYFDSVWGIA